MLLRNRQYLSNIEYENVQADKKDVDTDLTIWNAVQDLEQPYRTVITLFYYEDLSVKDISYLTGCYIFAV